MRTLSVFPGTDKRLPWLEAALLSLQGRKCPNPLPKEKRSKWGGQAPGCGLFSVVSAVQVTAMGEALPSFFSTQVAKVLRLL